MTKQSIKPNTIAARAGVGTDIAHGAVMPPLYLSSNYTFESFGQKRTYDYSRSGNPTRDILGDAIANLEGGFAAVITSSGMSAVDLPFQLLDREDLILVPHDCYGGTHRLLSARAKKGHFKVIFVNQTDEVALRAAFEEKPKMILVETPSNPLLRITDFALVTELAKAHNTIVVADNTFLSPVLQNPIALGADIVVHSTTKYLNGHSDVVGGAVVAKTQALHEELAWWANCTGTTGAPFDSYMTLRGLRTLDIRVKQQQETAGKVAAYLEVHNAVEKVFYPGLPTHEGYVIAQKQQRGGGAMLSFEMKGDVENIRVFLDRLKLFSLAESLGGVESLIAHPATMTHAAMDEVAQKTAGISPTLLRLSVGLEDTDDLITALREAL